MSGHEEKIRILHIHNYSNWGGNLQHLLLVMTGLDRGRFQPLLAAPAGEPYRQRFTEAGIGVLDFEASSRADWRAVFRLAALIREQRIAIVHSHLRRTDWICFWTRLFCPDCVFVTTVHGEVNRGADFSRAPSLRSWLYGLVLRRGFRQVLTVSRDLAEQLHREEGVARDRLLPLTNGIALPDPGLVSPEEKRRLRGELGLGEEELVLIQAGRFGRRKGQEVLIRALALLAGRGLHPLLLLPGDGDDLERCQALVQELGLARQVRFPGFCPDLLPLYQAADLVLMASYSEGIPRGLLEGMAQGLCPVASDIGGIREALAAPEYGLTFPAGDAQALAELLAGLLADRGRVRALGGKARERVRTAYRAETLINEHERCYRRLMNP